jgi:hypothetical protein
MGLAAVAGNLQALRFHGGKVSAARDEGDIGSRFGQRRPERRADPAGANHCNTHEFSPCSW